MCVQRVDDGDQTILMEREDERGERSGKRCSLETVERGGLDRRRYGNGHELPGRKRQKSKVQHPISLLALEKPRKKAKELQD